MELFLSIVLGVVVAGLAVTAAQLFNGNREDNNTVDNGAGEEPTTTPGPASEPASDDLVAGGGAADAGSQPATTSSRINGFNDVGNDIWLALVLGLIAFAANFLSPLAKAWGAVWLPPVMMAAVLVAYIILMVWWQDRHQHRKTVTELGIFLALVLLFLPVNLAAANATSGLTPSAFWTSVITVFPLLLAVFAAGFVIAGYFYQKAEAEDREVRDEEASEAEAQQRAQEANRDRNLGRMTIILTKVALILMAIFMITWGWIAPKPTTNPTSTTWYYYHYDVGGTYFGPQDLSVYPEISFKELYGRMGNDHVLGTAIMTNTDLHLNTDFAQPGYFIKDANPPEGKTTWMNNRSTYYRDHPDEYKEAIERWYKFTLDNSTRRIEDKTGLKDQMYMFSDGTSTDRAPGLVIMETDQPDGSILFFDYKIKDNTIQVPLRRNCGFQPTDVAELFEGAAAPVYTASVSQTPTPTNPGNPQNPPYTPSNPKDPNRGTKENTEPNDNPGPGPNTNNPADPNHSTADRSDNSTSYGSYEEYRDHISELEEINSNQRVGGDSNQPSTPTPTGTTVDSNADQGTGYGGIDIPTPISGPSHEAGTGQEINTNPGEAWEGPQD